MLHHVKGKRSFEDSLHWKTVIFSCGSWYKTQIDVSGEENPSKAREKAQKPIGNAPALVALSKSPIPVVDLGPTREPDA